MEPVYNDNLWEDPAKVKFKVRPKGSKASCGEPLASLITMTLTYVMVSLLFYALDNIQHHGNVEINQHLKF